MKKFILSILAVSFTLLTTACMNPSMEDGLEKMDKALAELAAAIEALNIPQMQADLEQMNIDAAQMLETVNGLEGDWEVSMQAFDELHERLQAILAQSENWATSEDMAGLLEQVEKFGDGVDLLVLQADYDYDGVINAIDQCPNTPLSEINNVNAQGCASGETPVSNGD